MSKILISMILLIGLVLADSPLVKTGQIESYDEYGDIVTDDSLKDDGFYQTGVTRNYSRIGNIVIDNVTHLQWQDDESITKPWITQANYDARQWSDTSGDTATTYCNELSLGGHMDWRLPNLDEYSSIVDEGHYHTATTPGVFTHKIAGYYWSSLPSQQSQSTALTTHFGFGAIQRRAKDNNNYIRCVREGQLKPENFTRNSIGIITDTSTHLEWQDIYTDNGNNIKHSTWGQAIDYCESLSLDGIGWRLPNIKELASIIDYSYANPAIDNNIFVNTASEDYWTSSTYSYDYELGWTVDFQYGYTIQDFKSKNYYIRCVRNKRLETYKITPIIVQYILE